MFAIHHFESFLKRLETPRNTHLIQVIQEGLYNIYVNQSGTTSPQAQQDMITEEADDNKNCKKYRKTLKKETKKRIL